jgi:hypothetical protein
MLPEGVVHDLICHEILPFIKGLAIFFPLTVPSMWDGASSFSAADLASSDQLFEAVVFL